jgi:hypothetical protein
MVRRRTTEAVSDQINKKIGQPAGLEQNLNATYCREFGLRDRQHAHRNKRAILATILILPVGTTRHITGHCDHIAHFGNSQRLRHNRSHQRHYDQPNDDEDREQPSDESAKIHIPMSHTVIDFESAINSHTCQMAKHAKKVMKYTWLISSRRVGVLPG